MQTGEATMITLTTESFDEEENRRDLTHWHDRIELIRILTGNTHCVVNGKDICLSEGDICVINRQQLHMMYCDEALCTFQRLLIDPVLFASNKTVYHQYLVPILTDHTFSYVKAEKRETADFSSLLDRMTELTRTTPVAYELEMIAMVYLLFQRLFVLYLNEKGKTTAPPNTDLLLFQKMADYIYCNYRDKLELADIAAAGKVSKSKCGSVFKEYTGHTPVDFMNLYRLKMSADLLRSTDRSISEIASFCGFGQQSYFNRLFLREYEVTPKQYREKYT